MAKFYYHVAAALCLLSCPLSARADTLIFNNTTVSSNVFQLPADVEVLDYGTSQGGWLSRFAFAYTSAAAGMVRVRFYAYTDNADPGLLMAEYDVPIPAAGWPSLCEYVIPEEDRFELPAGNFGYSFEISLPFFRVELTTGGDGISPFYWQEAFGMFWLEELDEPYNFYFQLYTCLSIEKATCDITGTKFNDLNGDGTWNTQEPVLDGWEFYLDLNNDGIHQPAEPNTLTNPNGFFIFENLPSPAVYRLREILPDGWTQTLPGTTPVNDYCYVIDTEPNNTYGPFVFGNHLPPLKYGGGDGSPEDPYQIRSPEHLAEIGLNPDDWGSNFILMADLDMTGTEYNVIGYYNSASDKKFFTGVFDGNRHVIRNLSYTRETARNYAGMFGYAQNAQIRDLGLENAYIASAGGAVGALVGCQMGGSIERCFVTGQVRGTFAGHYFGGLAGFLNGAIAGDCRSDVDVHVTTFTTGNYTGGFAGMALNLSNCYSSGSVIGHPASTSTGGLVSNQGAFASSFWDTEASGQTAGGGTPKTTVEMQTASTFAGWDFENTWRICDGMNYPRLKWEPIPAGDFVCPEGVELADVLFMADQWLMTGLSDADLAPSGQPDGVVDLLDLAALAAQWLTLTD